VTCRDEHALGDELFNLQAGLERWVKLYQRLWPEKPGVELVLDPRTAEVVSNLDELRMSLAQEPTRLRRRSKTSIGPPPGLGSLPTP
jgi:hypothetical protein